MSSGDGRLLVDTGFFFALDNEDDPHHVAALERQEWLEEFDVVIPWPVLYETMNTRFSRRRRRGVVSRFHVVVARQGTLLIDDSPYRHGAYGRAVQPPMRAAPVSLVDAVLLAIIEDVNVPFAAMLTFNLRDFGVVCPPEFG